MAGERVAREPSSARTWFELLRAWRHPIAFVEELANRVSEDEIPTIAAALAYYFFFSLFPLLLFMLALASVLPIRGLEAWLLDNVRQSLPGEAYTLVEQTVRSLLATPRSGLLSLGAGLALWTASSAIGAVMNGLNRAYRVRDPRPWWRVRLYAIGLTIALSMFMIVVFVMTLFGGQAVALVGRHLGPSAQMVAFVVRWTITIGAALVVVAAIYSACPACPKEWQWIRPGASVFMLGFATSSAAFSYYVGRFGSYDKTYGSLGAVIVLLFWMYLLGFFLLLGGELNALLEQRLCARDEAAEAATDEARATAGDPIRAAN